MYKTDYIFRCGVNYKIIYFFLVLFNNEGFWYLYDTNTYIHHLNPGQQISFGHDLNFKVTSSGDLRIRSLHNIDPQPGLEHKLWTMSSATGTQGNKWNILSPNWAANGLGLTNTEYNEFYAAALNARAHIMPDGNNALHSVFRYDIHEGRVCKLGTTSTIVPSAKSIGLVRGFSPEN